MSLSHPGTADRPTFPAPVSLTLPVTVQQVTGFHPRNGQPPALLLTEGLGVYYGDVDLEHGGPHGVGILLCRSPPPTGASGSILTPLHTGPPPVLAAVMALSKSYQAGDRYGGEWRNGTFDGEGVLVTSTFVYQGTFCGGCMAGRAKRIQYARNHVDRMPGAGDADGFVSMILLRGLSYLSPFDDSAHKPREYMGDYSATNFRHGQGLMRYYNGDVYEGTWIANRREGRGLLRRADGEVYEGLWKKDKQHGYGHISYPDGSSYKGLMQDGARAGEGVMVYPNGDEFFGNFVNDLIEGEGTMRYKNGDVYVGLWKNGARHGQGEYTLKRTGVTVKGNFYKGLIEGPGTVEYPGISLFVGTFERGERRQGTMHWRESAAFGAALDLPSESSRHHPTSTSLGQRHPAYTPSISNAAVAAGGPRRGVGFTPSHPDTSSSPNACAHVDKLCYQGGWVGENMHGCGKLWYRNGDFYSGAVVMNQRHGNGSQRYHVSGQQYNGSFVDDMRHGYGLEQNCDGLIRAGRWYRDVFIEGYEGEWDGKALNGVGRLRLSVESFLTGRRVGSNAPPPPPEEMMEFFGVFKNGLRDGPGVLKLPLVPRLFDKDAATAVGVLSTQGGGAPLLGERSDTRRPWKPSNKRKKDLSRKAVYYRRHVVKGCWRRDVLHCERALWAFPGGQVYVGGIEDGQRCCAVGRLWLPDGSVYVGSWRANTPCGAGQYFCKNPQEPMHQRLAPSVTPARPPSLPDEADTSRGRLDFITRLFSSREEPEAAQVEDSSPKRRILVGYRDHFTIVGFWDSCAISSETFVSCVVPDVQRSLTVEQPAEMANTTMAEVTLDGSAAHLEKEVATIPASFYASTESAGAKIVLPTPTTIPVGLQCGEGLVRYPSGVHVRTYWLDNYPQLAIPYRPGSDWDAFLSRLQSQGCLPDSFRRPSQCSHYTAALHALTQCGRTAFERHAIFVEVPWVESRSDSAAPQQDSPMLWESSGHPSQFVPTSAEAAAAAGVVRSTAQAEAVCCALSSTAGDARGVTATSAATGCTLCGRSYTFFRSAATCTLCLRSFCGGCLGSLEVSTRPDVAALVTRAHALYTSLQQQSSPSASQPFTGDVELPTSSPALPGTMSVPVCADCARMVLLRVRRQILCIPTRIFATVLQEHTRPLTTAPNVMKESVRQLGDEEEGEVRAHPAATDSLPPVSGAATARSSGPPLPAEAAETVSEDADSFDEASAVSSVHLEAPATPPRDPPPTEGVEHPSPAPFPPPHEVSDEVNPNSASGHSGHDEPPHAPSPSEEKDVVYAGYTANDVPHLWGQLWHGRQYYQGTFSNGQLCGYGTQVLPNGEKYVGCFAEGQWHGAGTYFAEDGSVFQGVFRRGKLRRLRYRGEVDDKLRPHGRGIRYETDGWISYNGMWQRGVRHGSGVLHRRDGSVYSGHFENGDMDGFGKLTTDTSTYYGLFRRSVKHGHGLELFSECAVEGEWEDDVSHGLCKIHHGSSGEVYETTYYGGNERDDCFTIPLMVDDQSMASCGQCRSNFSLFVRRHHCRLCGLVFCDTCSQKRATLPSHFKLVGPQRVCTMCFQRLEQRRALAVRRYADGCVLAGGWSQGRAVGRSLYCRPDGIFLVTDKDGQPILMQHPARDSGEGPTPSPATSQKSSLPASTLQDACPSLDVLNAYKESSPESELSGFTLWWAAMLSRCLLRVTLTIPLLQKYHQLPAAMLRGKEAVVRVGSEIATRLSSDPCNHCRFPRAPAMDAPSMFVSLEELRGGMRTNPASSPPVEDGEVVGYGYENMEAAALRVARFVHAVAPRPPSTTTPAATGDGQRERQPPPVEQTPADGRDTSSHLPHPVDATSCEESSWQLDREKTLAAAEAVPPRLADFDVSDVDILQQAANDRLNRFLVFPPPSPNIASPGQPQHRDQETEEEPMQPLVSYSQQPLLPLTPPVPQWGTNVPVPWDDGAARPVPAYRKGNSSRNTKVKATSQPPAEAAMYTACPYWPPHAPPIQELLEAGKLQAAAVLMHNSDAKSPTQHPAQGDTAGRCESLPSSTCTSPSDSEDERLDAQPTLPVVDAIPLHLEWGLAEGHRTAPSRRTTKTSSTPQTKDSNATRSKKSKRHPSALRASALPPGAEGFGVGWLPPVLSGPVKFVLVTGPGKEYVRVRTEPLL